MSKESFEQMIARVTAKRSSPAPASGGPPPPPKLGTTPKVSTPAPLPKAKP